MNNFEKITASPETLGAFLASLSIETSPWGESFRKQFCDSCERENCDEGSCPNQDVRNNPLWWLTQAAEGEQGTVGDSERELLIREYERRLARLKSGASPCGVIWKNGRVELEPGMIVPLQDEERYGSGICNDFNVYLNGKGPDGKTLRNIKKVIMPTVSAYENGQTEPMDMKLVFGGCDDAAEIVALFGKKCKLEVRAAVERWNQSGQIEFHGHSYILEAVPLEIDTDTVKRGAGLGLTIGFLVYRYTATVGDTQLWDFEWKEQERKKRK